MLVKFIFSLQTDFLIIGSGIAGLTTALTLADRGRVLVVTKSSLLEGSSRYAQAGIAAVRGSRQDSFSEHIRDTITAGAGLNNKRSVKFLVENAPKAVDWLEKLGVKFQKEPTLEAAHSHSRVWNTRDSTGKVIEKALAKKVHSHKNIELLTNTTLLDLIIAKKNCRGAIIKTGKNIYQVFAGQTILATGGFGQLYARTTNPEVSVGDGIAVAHRAGVKLKDLEFIQFHPTALVGKKTRLTLLSESLRGEGAVLRNVRGERFLPAYHPSGELAPRDIVARAIFAEMKKGPVYLDFTRASARFLRSRFPWIWKEVAKAGFNLAKDLIPIFPVAHYACGGVVTNLKGETNTKNFFAVGEVACTGVHGANRLASNSLAEAVVFGRNIGAIKKKIDHANIRKTDNLSTKYTLNSKEEISVIRAIKVLMWENVGIVRTKKGLAFALKKLTKLKPKSFLGINAVTVAKLVTKSALARKKSVGTHFIAN